MNDKLAETLMNDFAVATGLVGTAEPRRYLWTDAFALCNFLSLYDHTDKPTYLHLAVVLVDQVHHVLGRYRANDARSGWISGMSEENAEKHPTCGGLRIGKPLPERPANVRYHAEMEWDRDGQYFHYLTKWMHALRRLFLVTRDTRYLIWAEELAVTAHRAFVYTSQVHQQKLMFWKMSTDLSRALVPSMGQQDPLDGFVTFLELQLAASSNGISRRELEPGLIDFEEIMSGMRWATDDFLGIGGLLDSAARLTRLVLNDGIRQHGLLTRVLTDAIVSLKAITPASLMARSADQRLAFRELGLAIGIHEIEQCKGLAIASHDFSTMFDEILQHDWLASQIESFWGNASNRMGRTWRDHCDINSVMLGTSLLPRGFFEFAGPDDVSVR